MSCLEGLAQQLRRQRLPLLRQIQRAYIHRAIRPRMPQHIGRFLAPVEYYTVYKAPRLLRSQQINILGCHALGPSERRYTAYPLPYLLPCQFTRAGPGACLIGQRNQQIPAGKVGRQSTGQPIL